MVGSERLAAPVDDTAGVETAVWEAACQAKKVAGGPNATVMAELLHNSFPILSPEEIRQIIINPKISATVLYDGAPELVEELVRRQQPSVIWTQGDMKGRSVVLDSGEEEVFPGSNEQLRKLVFGSIPELRREMAVRALEKSGATDSVPERAAKMLSVIAVEDKFNDEVMNQLVAMLRQHNLSELTVIEDRYENIVRLRERLAGGGVHVSGIWVGQGAHGRKGKDEVGFVESYDRRVESIKEITAAMLRGLAVSDFDGVLSDDHARRRRQAALLTEALREAAWGFV